MRSIVGVLGLGGDLWGIRSRIVSVNGLLVAPRSKLLASTNVKCLVRPLFEARRCRKDSKVFKLPDKDKPNK
jgi:hypothetical protein